MRRTARDSEEMNQRLNRRTLMPTQYFRHLSGYEWLKEQYRTHLRGKTRRQMMPELFRHHTADVDSFYDSAALLRDKGFRDGTQSFFYNHHEAHALARVLV